jgi:hypothetical protein
METVKVDMQKLQLLNDRIAQTIDALNQLRLSVHGIQHTPSAIGWNPNVQMGYGSYGTFSPYGAYNPVAFAQPTFGQPTFVQPFGSPFVGGIQHTSPVTGYGWPQQTWAQPTFQPTFQNGLSHTTWEPTWQQTRPF